MAELKRFFGSATMNKDLDERLVRDGQYRDALNIQIATSDGGDLGAVQTLMGNTIQNTVDGFGNQAGTYSVNPRSTCVGSIASVDRDKIYYFIDAGSKSNASGYNDIRKDYILEYDVITSKHKYVFVDIYDVRVSIAVASSSSQAFLYIPNLSSAAVNKTGVRIGMSVTGTLGDETYSVDDGVTVSDIIYNTGNSSWKIIMEKDGVAFQPPSGVDASDVINFVAAKVLRFSKNNTITGINILDDFIYWTDNESEPKKVNIPRSIAGTGGVAYLKGGGIAGYASANTGTTSQTFVGDKDDFHTRLVKDKIISGGSIDPYEVVTLSDKKRAVYVEEKHVTVIKKAPTQPLELEMLRSSSKRVNTSTGLENPVTSTFNQAFPEDIPADPIGITFDSNVDFRASDIILIRGGVVAEDDDFLNYDVRAEIVSSNVTGPDVLDTIGFEIKILSKKGGLSIASAPYTATIESIDSLFEFKFPRFSYRYKYQDGEYSTFAPWSEVAFLSDTYEYEPKKGYNFGMVNQLRSLKLKEYFASEGIMSDDISEIDLLYKETNNPTVYTVKTIKQTDDHPMWPDRNSPGGPYRGEYELTTDMVHAVVPSNQLLRPWDNVPRRALAQEISANRLIYGNYVQNYTVLKDPIVNVTSTESEVLGYAGPSVKSMRTYQVGVVFSDSYGRETPVLTHQNSSVRVEKKHCGKLNKLKCNLLKEIDAPSWAKYYSYYVKETSVEYHTLAMDRWYDAWDGNIWLSFPSSDRNKVDNETFLVLKKEHGTTKAVTAKARYKVLAIENEAPDYIKTVSKSLGVCPGGSGNNWSVGGSSGNGWPRPGYLSFTITESAFHATFGENFLTETKEGLRVRFWGGVNSSIEYPVANISKPSGYEISLEVALGQEMSWTGNPTGGGEDSNPDTRISNLGVELISHTIENRPEFDGRFFVKIFKDQELESSVLSLSNQAAAATDVVSAEWKLGYLNNNGLGEAATRHDPPDDQLQWRIHFFDAIQNELGWGDIYYPNKLNPGSYFDVAQKKDVQNKNHPYYDRHPTAHGYHRHDGAVTWSGANSAEYVWNNNYITNGSTTDHVQDSIQGSPAYINYKASAFWRDMASKGAFFIDACTEFTRGGHNAHDGRWHFTGDDTGSGSSNHVEHVLDTLHSGFGSYLTPNAQGEGGLSQSQNPTNDSNPTTTYTNAQDFGALTARGIHDYVQTNYQPNVDENLSASVMDISWTGMGEGWRAENQNKSLKDENLLHGSVDLVLENVPYGGQNGSSENGVHTSDYENDGIDYPGAWEFIKTLTTVGTRFSFRDDPDGEEKTVYTVLGLNVPQRKSLAWCTTLNSGGYYTTMDYAGFENLEVWKPGSNRQDGAWGIRNYGKRDTTAEGNNENAMWRGENLRQRWSIVVSPQIGTQGSGYDPQAGTMPPSMGGPYRNSDKYKRPLNHDMTSFDAIQIITKGVEYGASGVGSGIGAMFMDNPAVWETEPKESVDLDIYYQASGLIPLELNPQTNEEYLPIGSTFTTGAGDGSVHTITGWDHDIITFTPALVENKLLGSAIEFNRNTSVRSSTARVHTAGSIGQSTLKLEGGPNTQTSHYKLFSQHHHLKWSNCWSFGNGIESDRIRDDFNAPQMDNGVKASSVLGEQNKEEHRKHGLIWSGLYNSNSGVNETNQFIMAEAITKDLNPSYGSIQALLNRDTRLQMFCEDKVLYAVTNKDALYNADGNPQLVASNAVIGDAQAYQGNFGISKNPESMAVTPYRTYFTDANRNQVLSLSTEGIRSISDIGMKDYFTGALREDLWRVLGTYDPRKTEYNVTISKKVAGNQAVPSEQTTVSYSEASKGWTSFKSFHPQQGVGINNEYYTFSDGQMYKHHTNALRNNFYGAQYASDITALFNDTPNTIKNFATINYEGSQAKVTEFDSQAVEYYNNNYTASGTGEENGLTTTAGVNDNQYFNLSGKTGWYVDNVTTDLQRGGDIEFKEKEGKWFGVLVGEDLNEDNLPYTAYDQDSSIPTGNKGDASVQGVGLASIQHSDSGYNNPITITVANNITANSWDDAANIAAEASYWTCTPATHSAVAGATISSETVELTISDQVDGDYSGFPISAATFAVPNSTSSTGVGTYIYTSTGTSHITGDNDIVQVVTFSDNGEPNVPGNTVKVLVTFLNGATWPAVDTTYFIDIDNIAGTPTGYTRPVCVGTNYMYWDTTFQAAPVVYDTNQINEVTETQVTAGGPTVNPSTAGDRTRNKHTGTVDDSTTTEIARVTFARADNKYYLAGSASPSVSFSGATYDFAEVGEYLSSSIDLTYTGSLITGFVAHIYYTPPPYSMVGSFGFDIDEVMNRCGIEAYINFSMATNPTIDVDGDEVIEQGFINKFSVDGPGSPYGTPGAVNIPQNGMSANVSVHGTHGSVYNIYCHKKASLSSDEVASTYGHYNFSTNEWQTAVPPLIQGVLPANQTPYVSPSASHPIVIDNVSTETRYAFSIDGGPVYGLLSTFGSGVTTPLIYHQDGIGTVDFAVGADTSGIFAQTGGTSTAVIKPTGYSNPVQSFSQVVSSVNGAQAAGTSGKYITLNKESKYIRPGMYVINPFGQTGTLNAIPHLTKVVSVDGVRVVLNNALQAPGLTDNEEVRFICDNNSVVPFSFSVAPGAGASTIDAVKTNLTTSTWETTMGGLKPVMILTSAARNSARHQLDNVKGIVVGMTVTGDGIAGINNVGHTYVATIVDADEITLTTTENLADDAMLTFSDSDEGSTPAIQRGLNLLHVQAVRNSGANALVQGYIKYSSIEASVAMPLYLGDIFTYS